MFQHSPMPTKITNQIKNNYKANICDILIISCNFDIKHSYTYLKTWRKELKRLKILKYEPFLYPCLQNKIEKLSKKPLGTQL